VTQVAPAWTERRVHHPDAPGLGALVPDRGAFLAADFDRHLVLTSDRAVAAFATPAALWADVIERGARTPTFRLVRDGATLPPSTYCRRAGIGHRTLTDVIQPNRVLELHAAGATMVVQGLQLTDPHLARVANNLALDLQQPVQVNAYLTPEAAKGLELHFDYHDVFVVHLEGSKRWRVWEPLERTRLPVRAAGVPMPTLDELGSPALDHTFRPGDVLYLPRGFPHAAETVDAASTHLTIGVVTLSWHQAVRHAVDDAVASGALRATVRLDGASRPGLEELGVHLAPDSMRRWLAREVWRRQPATRLRPRVAPAIELDTAVTLTPGPLLWLTKDGPRCELGLGDRALSLPAEAHDFLAALLATDGPFRVSALDADLDPGSRLVVGRRLAEEGVIAVTEVIEPVG
jgi:bifunctional lysine-specific demethylase and histidyl-hydroxylase NO66